MKRLSIRHETVYRYSEPPDYTIQQLRLTPRSEKQQQVLSWHIEAPGQLHAITDAYGNLSHTLTVHGRHEQVAIVAEGIVEVRNLEQGRLLEAELQSPLVFTIPTLLTAATPAVQGFAATHLAPGSALPTRDFLHLAESICTAVSYQSGATVVTSSADHALQLGQGVCQDHAHLFLACCHARGIPARYVSGYIDADTPEHAETHAWVDVWCHEAGSAGWTSIDVTHACLMSDAYCRIAIGRDYDSAAPIRGMRHGGGEETMAVKVLVRTL